MQEERRSEWQGRELAQTFLEGVRGAIPAADLQLLVIGKIADQWCPAPRRILDLGCGNGILGRFLLERFPRASGLFLDFSAPMLEAARAYLGTVAGATIAEADFGSPGWLEVARPHGPFDIVVSGFAIHHQPDDRKRAIYAEAYQLLAPGGIFLNLEHVASATPAAATLHDELFIDHLHAFHTRADPAIRREVVADRFYNRPDKQENLLAPVDEQCQWLRQAGYTDVDCFFKIFELALFGGRKAGGG